MCVRPCAASPGLMPAGGPLPFCACPEGQRFLRGRCVCRSRAAACCGGRFAGQGQTHWNPLPGGPKSDGLKGQALSGRFIRRPASLAARNSAARNPGIRTLGTSQSEGPEPGEPEPEALRSGEPEPGHPFPGGRLYGRAAVVGLHAGRVRVNLALSSLIGLRGTAENACGAAWGRFRQGFAGNVRMRGGPQRLFFCGRSF